MEKMIIYRDFDGLKATFESNYSTRCRDFRKILDLHNFHDAEEAREYICTYFGYRDEDFIDLTPLQEGV